MHRYLKTKHKAQPASPGKSVAAFKPGSQHPSLRDGDNPYCQLPEHAFSKQEIADQLLSCIETLPVKCRKVIELHYFENKTIDDIRATIGMSESTVRNRLGYGLFLLKKKMAEKPKNPV